MTISRVSRKRLRSIRQDHLNPALTDAVHVHGFGAPILDAPLPRLHTETASRCGGALALPRADLDQDQGLPPDPNRADSTDPLLGNDVYSRLLQYAEAVPDAGGHRHNLARTALSTLHARL